MVLAGQLREIIKIEEPVYSQGIGFEQSTTYTSVLDRTYAMVVEERSNPREVANQENIKNYVHLRIRYRPVFPVKIGYRITWRGFYFIVDNIKVDKLRRYIDMYITSEMETSNRGEVIVLGTFDDTFDDTFN